MTDRTIELDGKSIIVPEGMSDEEALKVVAGEGATVEVAPSSQPSSSVSLPSQAAPNGKFDTSIPASPEDHGNMVSVYWKGKDPSTLKDDPEWIKSTQSVYKAKYGVNHTGTPEEVADWGLNQMAYFNYNLPSMGYNAAKMSSAPEDAKKGFLYMMDKFDETRASWAGAGRWLEAAATDPFTWVGIETLGLGAVANATEKTITKETLKSVLNTGLKMGVIGAVENTAQSAAQGATKQIAEMNLGRGDKFDWTRWAAETALGGALGFAAGGTLGVGAGGVKYLRSADAPEITPDAGATPNATATGAPDAAPAKQTLTLDGISGLSEKEYDHLIDVKAFAERNGEKINLENELYYIRNAYRDNVEKSSYSYTSSNGKNYSIDLDEERSGKYLNLKGVSASERTTLMAIARDAKKAGTEFNAADELANIRKTTDNYNKDLLQKFQPENILDPAERVMMSIEAVTKGNSLLEGIFPKTKAAVSDAASEAEGILANMGRFEAKKAIQELAEKALTGPERQILTAAFKQSTQQLMATTKLLWEKIKVMPDGPEKLAALCDLKKYENIRDNVREGDLIFSSMDGRNLGNRANEGLVNTGEFRAISEDTIIEGYGKDPALHADLNDPVRQQAKQEFYQLINAHIKKAEELEHIAALTEDITNKLDNYTGTEDEFNSILKVLEERLEAKEAAGAESLGIKIAKGVINDVNGFMISNVFSPATTVRNFIPSMIKTVSYPAMMALARGADGAAVKSMLTFYHTMYNNMGVALKMSRISAQLERSLITADRMKYFEGGNGIIGPAIDKLPDGNTKLALIKAGEAIRVFPTILQRTDEIFAQLNYRGYHMAEAHYNAIKRSEHLTGEARENYIEGELKRAAENMFGEVENKPDVLDLLYKSGRDRGLHGDALERFVKTHVDDNFSAFRSSHDQAALGYTEDMLFKKKFSGKNIPSALAKDYEDIVNKYPIMRTVGQLFFRTPVRVVEDGIRMTPGMGLISQKFRDDIAGKNGPANMARAHSQVMIGYALTSAATMLWANGKITGAGPDNYKEADQWRQKGWEPYTITLGDKKFTYKNYDPFTTPLKMLVNTLERLDALEMRRAQGEFVGQEYKQTIAMFSAVVAGLGSAIKDASLFGGADQGIQLVQELFDPSDSDTAMQKWFGKKLQTLIPFEGTLSKVQGITGQGQTPDPITAEQFIRAKVAPDDPSLAHKHDSLGNYMHTSTPWGNLFGIQISDADSRKAGRDEKDMAVLSGLAEITAATGATFAMPYKSEWLPGIDDLRRETTKDGSMNLYDRANQIMREQGITDALYGLVVGGKDIPNGNRVEAGDKVKAIKKTFSDFYKLSFIKLMSEQTGLSEAVVADKIKKLQIKSGQWEAPSPSNLDN